VTMSKRDVVVFGFCLVFTIAGCLLLPSVFQTRYWADVLTLTPALVGGTIITIKSMRALLDRNFGVDVLASIAVWMSILVGEYLAAAVVVVMLNGGEFIGFCRR